MPGTSSVCPCLTIASISNHLHCCCAEHLVDAFGIRRHGYKESKHSSALCCCSIGQQRYRFYMKRPQLNGLDLFFFFFLRKGHARLALSEKRHHKESEGRERKSQLDREGKKEVGWRRETESESDIEWKGQRSPPDFDGCDQKGPGFISCDCHCGDRHRHQQQPRGIQISTRGKWGERNEKPWKSRPSPLMFLFAVRLRIQKKTTGGEATVTVNSWKHDSEQPFVCLSTTNSYVKGMSQGNAAAAQASLFNTRQTQSQSSIYGLSWYTSWERHRGCVHVLSPGWHICLSVTLDSSLSQVVVPPTLQLAAGEQKKHAAQTQWIGAFGNLKCQLSNLPVFNLGGME